MEEVWNQEAFARVSHLDGNNNTTNVREVRNVTKNPAATLTKLKKSSEGEWFQKSGIYSRKSKMQFTPEFIFLHENIQRHIQPGQCFMKGLWMLFRGQANAQRDLKIDQRCSPCNLSLRGSTRRNDKRKAQIHMCKACIVFQGDLNAVKVTLHFSIRDFRFWNNF